MYLKQRDRIEIQGLIHIIWWSGGFRWVTACEGYRDSSHIVRRRSYEEPITCMACSTIPKAHEP